VEATRSYSIKGMIVLIDRPFARKPGIDWPTTMAIVLAIAAIILAVLM